MKLPSLFQQYIHLSRYARWIDSKNRRETPQETVARYFDFFEEYLEENNDFDFKPQRKTLENAVNNLEVMPSMRALMTAGPALKRENISGFNCAYIAVEHPRVFDEILYVLMCGTGVGFSVETQYVSKLPCVPDALYPTDTTIVVRDSKLGWAVAFKELINLLYAGLIPEWNTRKVRKAGERLKIFGGRASGPGPLIDLFNFTVATFKGAAGRQLTSIEAHDIACKIGEVVVMGGVRRSALIGLSDINDLEMRDAKSSNWFMLEPQRALANNSAVYNGKPTMSVFMSEWAALYKSKSGERGIFNRNAANLNAANAGRREAYEHFGLNPCGEVILRSAQFCNLSEVVARYDDTLESLKKKVRLATILGTIQSCLTNFKYIRKIWKDNTEEERLLGVSITGIMDCAILQGDGVEDIYKTLKEVAIKTNKEWAKKLGINQSVSISVVKPSGTVSSLCNTSSGIHTRYAPYYIRRVRSDKKDPLTRFMIDHGFPFEDEVMKPNDTVVFSFPMKSPDKAKCRNDFDAISQLDHWLKVKENWCEHNPSQTIDIREDEWFKVAAWVYEHFDSVTGLSFLPYSDHNYQQAPFEEIDEVTFKDMVSKMPTEIDWSGLVKYESEDQTTSTQELACMSGSCEI